MTKDKNVPQEPGPEGSRTREIDNELVSGTNNGFGDKVVGEPARVPSPETSKVKGEPRVRQGAEAGAEKDLKRSQAGEYDNYGLKKNMENGTASGSNDARPIRPD